MNSLNMNSKIYFFGGHFCIGLIGIVIESLEIYRSLCSCHSKRRNERSITCELSNAENVSAE